MRKVSVFGLGYVGSVTGACLARDGRRVIGVDIDPEKVAAVGRGVPPIHEPGLPELLGGVVSNGRLTTTTNAQEAVRATEVAIICVGTPTASDQSPDLR